MKARPEYTLAAVLTDKEEIGSVGATGMGAMYFENTMAELIACVTGEDKPRPCAAACRTAVCSPAT